MDNADNCWCGFEDLDPRDVCVGISESLPHPAVLLDFKGRLVHKNKKFSWVNFKWRIGTSIDYYIGKENFIAALSTKTRDYNAFFVNNIPAISLKIGGNFFIVFLSDFEANSSYITCIYEYIEDAVERILLQLCQMKESSEGAKNPYALTTFEKRLRLFFDDKSMYGRNARGVLFGDRYIKRHRIEDILKSLGNIGEKSSFGRRCNIKFKEHRSTYGLYIYCSPEELGVVLSMMLFSCIICSSSKKPDIEITYLKNKKSDVGEITFSAKSDIDDITLRKIMNTREYVDEKSIYFKAINAIAFKNFWTFRAYRSGGRLCFSLVMVGEQPAPFTLSDCILESTIICIQNIEKFFTEVLLPDSDI